MTPDVTPLVAGNWKMNGTRASLDQIKAMAEGVKGPLAEKVETLICPPATLLYVATALSDDSPLLIGAQDCHEKASGAHTGDVSAEMIADCFGTHVIVGHSERRTDHKESDALVRAKAEIAHQYELVAIVCIGETGDERKGGKTLDVLKTQLAGSVPDGATADNTVIAYEPVWAIGTGLTASPEQAQAAHAYIRGWLTQVFGEATAARVIVQYGGSVKADNAEQLLACADIDGALVGGASLKASDFLAIIKAGQDVTARGKY
jgi:triosephosphate isomerase